MPADGVFDRFPVRRIEEESFDILARDAWPAPLAPVAYLLDNGLDLGSATVFVGENGSGKSTLVEAIGLAFGLLPEGGSTGAQHSTRASESVLWSHLRVVGNAGESYLDLAESRFRGPGLWLLDEPESALSFSGCLALLGILTSLLETGTSQVILSTHSPLLASLPGATIYEAGDWACTRANGRTCRWCSTGRPS